MPARHVIPSQSDPASPGTGELWLSTTTANSSKYYDGTTTRTAVDLSLTQTLTNKTFTSPSLTSPVVSGLTTNGVVYADSSAVLVNTAQGAANSVLTANAGAPSFSATPTITSLTATSSLVVGTTPATTGVIRIPSGQAIQSRNSANSGDNQVLVANASDQLVLGIGSSATIPANDNTSSLGVSGTRWSTGYFGTSINLQGANAQTVAIRQTTESHTLAAAATSDTTITAPADSLVIGVTVRVTTTITGSAGTTFDIGVAGATTRYNPGAGAPVFASGTTATSPGTTNPTIYSAATKVRFTCGGGGNFTAGVVRVTIHYIDLTAPTS